MKRLQTHSTFIFDVFVNSEEGIALLGVKHQPDLFSLNRSGQFISFECLAEMHRDSCPLDCKVYVGNLGNNGNKTELERAFGYYGPLRSVWVARNPPGFAFVEFEDPRDAADAVRELDGRQVILCLIALEQPIFGHLVL